MADAYTEKKLWGFISRGLERRTPMCSLSDEYNWFRSGFWACEDPDECPCHGRGYALSDVDTWHECPIHHVAGQHHPEDECDCGHEICTSFGAAPTEPAPAPTFADDEIPF